MKEDVPRDAYGLLRRIVDRGPQRIRHDDVARDTPAQYLVSRGLATPSETGDRVENTDAGRIVGLIDIEPD